MAGNPDWPSGQTWAGGTIAPAAADPTSGRGTIPGIRSDGLPNTRRPRALTVLAVVAAALFAIWGIGGPLFGTSVLAPTDEMVTQGPWVNAGLSGGPATNSFLDDTYTSQLPSTMLFTDQLGKGNVAEWNPYASGGTPLGALPDFAFYSPLTIPFYLLPAWLAPAYEHLLEIICAVGATFLFLRRLHISRAAAITGGLVFASSGFMVAWLGFPQTRVAAFIPVLFWAVERFIQLRRVRDAALIAVPIAAMVLGGFPAVAAYGLLTGAGYALVRLIGTYRDELRRLVRPVLLLAGSVVAGLALTLFQVIPFLAFYQTWLVQGRVQHATSHLELSALLTSVAPWAFGSVDPSTGGTQFVLHSNLVEAASYVGAAAVVLVLVALALPRRGRALLPRGVWVFVVAATLVWAELIYVGGWPLTILQHTPVLRTVFGINFIGRSRSVFGFLLATLMAVGFELVLRSHKHRRLSGKYWWAWPVCFTVAAVALADVLVGFGRKDDRAGAEFTGQDVGDALYLYRNQVLIAAAVGVVAVVCVVLMHEAGARPEGQVTWRRIRLASAIVLLALITAQATQYVVNYFPHSPRASFYPSTDTHQYLAANLGHQRYASSITGMEFGTNSGYQLRAVNGHAFVDKDFGALVRGIPDNPLPYATYIDFQPSDVNQATSPVLDRLGTKYYVASPADSVFGKYTEAPVNRITRLVPGRPVTVPLLTTGPLRAIAFTPSGKVPASLSTLDNDSTVDVVLRDATGSQIARSQRLTAGMAADARFEVALTGEAVPVGTRLTATITLHTKAALDIYATNTAPAVDSITDADDHLRVVHVGSTVIYQRLDALPRIRWASTAEVVPSADQRVRMLAAGGLADSTVVLSQPGPVPAGKPATVDVRSDGTDSISTDVRAQGAGYLVVADADHVGWVAAVDGIATPLVPADQGLVAVAVPAGEHTVVLRYGLSGAVAATWVSVTVAVLLVAVAFGEWWWERRRATPRAGPVAEGPPGSPWRPAG
jgi:hypothetical protein